VKMALRRPLGKPLFSRALANLWEKSTVLRGAYSESTRFLRAGEEIGRIWGFLGNRRSSGGLSGEAREICARGHIM
jgi:hypothetical protein